MTPNVILGIDLGTTKSAASIFIGGKPFIIPDATGNQSIPSLVLVTPNKKIFAGRAAKNHPDRYKSKNITISSIKRMMGKYGETGWGWWKTYPQEVSAFILAELKSQAEKYLDEKIDKAVIAIPSHFDENQRRATKEAAEIAGLEPVRLLNEATASAITHSFYSGFKEENLLVFDFGGGTLDLSVINIGGSVLQVRCVEGDSKLGGDDFDQIIADYIIENLHQKYSAEITLDNVQKMMLKEASESAKIELSSKSVASIHIPGFVRIGKSYHDLDISIDRQTFEGLSQGLFKRVSGLIDKTLSSAGIRSSHLDSVLLVGGSSQIPYIKKLVEKKIGKRNFARLNPITCVAEGAAIQAGIIQGSMRNIVLVDVIPTSYGIGIEGDIFSKLIKKNSPVPTSYTQVFTTSEDNQSTIRINIYQGEKSIASENTYLSTLELQNIPPSLRGIPQIEVTFAVDENMIVHVTAKDKGTHREQRIIVKSPYGLNEAQIRIMKQRLQSSISESRFEKVKYLIQTLKSSISDLIENNASILDWNTISTLKKCLSVLDNLLISKEVPTEMEVYYIEEIYQKAETSITKYKSLVKEINKLAMKIDEFIFMLKTVDAAEVNLLMQGEALLNDSINRKIPYNELHNIFLSVQSEYINAKSCLIEILLVSIKNSAQVKEWCEQSLVNLTNLRSLNEHLLKLKKLKEVNGITAIFGTEDSEYQKMIQERTIKNTKKETDLLAYFIIITFPFVNIYAEPEFSKLLSNNKIGHCIAFSVFSGLNKDKPMAQRLSTAKLIAEDLPADSQYLPLIVDCLDAESDEKVKDYLIDFLNKYSSNDFYNFFKSADLEIKNKITNNKEMLIKLANVPDNKTRIIAIENLLKFPTNEIMQTLFSFIDSNDTKIRAKTLELIRAKGLRLQEIIKQAMQNPSPGIRLLALEYIQQTPDNSYLPALINFLREESENLLIRIAIATLGKLKDPNVLPPIFDLLINGSAKTPSRIVFYLKTDDKLMKDDFKHFLELMIKVKNQKQLLGAKDKVFLWHFAKRNKEMKQVVEDLKKINDKLRK